MGQAAIFTPQPQFGSGAPSGSPKGGVAVSTGQVYYDTDTVPYTGYVWNHNTSTWVQFGQAGGPAAVYAHSTSQPADPTAPASTSAFKMQGLAGAITPSATGKVLVTVSGTVIGATTTAGDGIALQVSHGTGAAPANAANLTGTQDGTIQKYTQPATVTAADVHVPFSMTVLLTGLTLSTAYWLDLAAESIGTVSSGGLSGINIVAVELP